MSNFTLPSLPVTFFAIGGSQTSKQFNGKKPVMALRGLLVSCFPLCPPIIIEYKHFNCARQKKASINIFEEFVLMPLMESTSLSWFGPHLLSWQVLAVMTTWTFNEEKCWTLFERVSGWSFPTVAHGQDSPTT
jgi:hypothetical protein